jgi:hypothetical protein
MPDADKPKAASNYQALLVRLWRDDDKSPWRASAQRAGSEEVVRLACLEQLFIYLNKQTIEEEV